ncbi:hypothetical protein V8C37DRAFT_171506 [Trichoderma ceciliae]
MVSMKCDGSLLMVKLHMDEVLKATNQKQCRNIFKSLPNTASEAYNIGLKRLSEAAIQQNANSLPRRVIQALFWVAYTKAPMKEKELRQGLAVELEDTDYDEEKEDLTGFDALCGELLLVDTASEEVRVAHKTVTEHLLEETAWRD